MIASRTPDFAVQMFLERHIAQLHNQTEPNRSDRDRRRDVRHHRRHANRLLRSEVR